MSCVFLILSFVFSINTAIAEEKIMTVKDDTQQTSTLAPTVIVDPAAENKPVSFNSVGSSKAHKSPAIAYSSPMPSTTATLLKALGGLVIVVLTIFAASALAKRVGLTNVSLRKRIQVRENVVVGSKERLVLIDFAGQSLLLGVTAGSISLIKSVPQSSVGGQDLAKKENSLGAKTAIDFQQKLNAFLLKGQQ